MVWQRRSRRLDAGINQYPGALGDVSLLNGVFPCFDKPFSNNNANWVPLGKGRKQKEWLLMMRVVAGQQASWRGRHDASSCGRDLGTAWAGHDKYAFEHVSTEYRPLMNRKGGMTVSMATAKQ